MYQNILTIVPVAECI